jgi:alkylation response protein AidB-like acyl-CoA dehydrogenase
VDSSTLDWPFFTSAHRELADNLEKWANKELADETGDANVDDRCREIVKSLGNAGWLELTVPPQHGGERNQLDVRSLCIARETLARVSGLADFSFAMQGLGAGPISLFGSDDLKKRYLPRVASGDAIAAFALSEEGAGSDISAMQTTAQVEGDTVVVNGVKTWISNGGIADFYVVFCRMQNGYTAVVVEPGDDGFAIVERITTIAPHPLARISFNNCNVPSSRVVGEQGKGLKVALGTLDVFRSTVGAAALGFARRALDEALKHVCDRKIFGKELKEFQLTQAKIAKMATAIDASALLIYRAAWVRDNGAPRITREAAMAKMYATEAAQRVIDDAVQLLGGRGVVAGHPVEKLYREIRSLRIYEGTTEVQQLVIASQVLKNYEESIAGA